MTPEARAATRPAAALSVVLMDGGVGEIEACLGALHASAGSTRMEILVPLQPGQSPPPALSTADGESRRQGLAPVFLELPSHAGFAAMANAAGRCASAPVLLLLSPSVRVRDRGIARSLSFLNRFTDIGSAVCRIENGSGRYLNRGRELPNVRSSILYGLTALPALVPPLRALLGRWMTRYHTGRYDRYAGWLLDGFLLLRREAFLRVGGFDETLTRVGALIDLHRRLAGAGYRSASMAEATAVVDSPLRRDDYPRSAWTRGHLDDVRANGTGAALAFFRWSLAINNCPGLLSWRRDRRRDARLAVALSLASTFRRQSGNSTPRGALSSIEAHSEAERRHERS